MNFFLKSYAYYYIREKAKNKNVNKNHSFGISRNSKMIFFCTKEFLEATVCLFKHWRLLQFSTKLTSSGSQDCDWSQLFCFDSVAPWIIPNVHHYRAMNPHNYRGSGCYFSFPTCFEIILGIIWYMK